MLPCAPTCRCSTCPACRPVSAGAWLELAFGTEEAPGRSGEATVLLGHLRRWVGRGAGLRAANSSVTQEYGPLLQSNMAAAHVTPRAYSAGERAPTSRAGLVLPPPPPFCLRSYQGMGMARVECASGCTCAPSDVDGLWEQQVSLMQLHAITVRDGAGLGGLTGGRRSGGCNTQPEGTAGRCWDHQPSCTAAAAPLAGHPASGVRAAHNHRSTKRQKQ